MWYSTITVANLAVNNIYHFGLDITDSATPVANAFHMPYQVGTGSTPARLAYNAGNKEMALTFSTFPGPIPGSTVLKPGVKKVFPGVKIK
jgi:hypothetical protein